MSTNAEVIGDALKEINVIGETDSVSAEQGSYALRILNDLMEAWEVGKDFKLGYFAQTDTTATCPIPAWARLGVVSGLAIKLAPNYGKTVSIELTQKYEDGYQIISRQSALQAIQPLDDRHLPQGAGHLGYGWDINSGP